MKSSFSYEVPATRELLILSAYFYLLNVFERFAQWLLSAGLLGQIAIGIIFGSPLAGWLEFDWQRTFVSVGYIGLLLLVFEGGIVTDLSILSSVLPLSTLVALTGLITPIALSFILSTRAFGFPHLHSFAAGSSLSSTSLGTSLAVLKSNQRWIGADLQQTRLGTVLMGAAIMDDVVAFVLSEIILELGQIPSDGTSSRSRSLGTSIGRAIGSTLGLSLLAIVICRSLLRLLLAKFSSRLGLVSLKSRNARIFFLASAAGTFIGSIAAAGFAGTSPLFGVYTGGLILSYIDARIQRLSINHPKVQNADMATEAEFDHASSITSWRDVIPLRRIETYPMLPKARHRLASERTVEVTADPACLPFAETFSHYISQPLNYILLPLFFGSIGYSIPFLSLWRGSVIWKGIVYAVLMFFGKVIVGVWLLWWPLPKDKQISNRINSDALAADNSKKAGLKHRIVPASLIGLAMVARGEIGLLISQIAYNTPDPQLTGDEFLIVTWAIVLCTIVGPMSVGWLVKRQRGRVIDGGWD